MPLLDLKIKDSEFAGKNIKSLPDKPSEAGITAAQLKAFFDMLAEDLIAKRFNAALDLLVSAAGAANIGISPIPGAQGANAQELLAVLKRLQDAHAGDHANPHRVVKEQVGLGKVDNTADAQKPVSAAVRGELDRISRAAADAVDTAREANAVASGMAGDVSRAVSYAKEAQKDAARAVELAEGVYYQYDPADGEKKPIQAVLYSLFNQTKPAPMSAKEFRDLRISAAAFRDKRITAGEFSKRGKAILGG